VIKENMAKDDFNFKKEYEKLKKKFNSLPDFKELNDQFEFSSMKDFPEDEDFLLRNIRRKINDRFANLSRFIEETLNPNPGSIIGITESKKFTLKDREELRNLLKNLMLFERKSLLLEIEFDNDKEANFINESLNNWKNIKKDFKPFIKKMMDSWDTKEEKQTNHYFG
jgi:hypothetical protein